MEALASSATIDTEKLDQRIAAFEQEISNNSIAITAPGKDEHIASFSSAVRLEYAAGSQFRTLVNETLLSREDIRQPSLAANILLRVFQKQLLRRENKYPQTHPYPGPYTSVLPWRRVIREMTSPQASELAEIAYDLSNRLPQSNIVERYKSFSIILQLMHGVFDRKPNVLDVGCSQNLGLKRLALGSTAFDTWEILPFNPIAVSGVGGIHDKERKSRMLNTLLQYTYGVGDSTGVDIHPINDEDSKEWAKACSFYPQELLDQRLVTNYDLLDYVEPTRANIRFYQANFGSLTRADIRSINRDKHKFDMVTFSTVLNQVSEEERESMLDNARKLIKPHGLIVVQDFARLRSERALGLQFYDNWFGRPYRYRTFIADNSDDFQSLHEIMRWDNGRCNKLQLNRSIGRLALAAEFGLTV